MSDAPSAPNPPADPQSPSPKIPADDPRLRIGRARGRTLKKGPAIALLVGLAGVALFALTLALQPSAAPHGQAKSDVPATAAPQPPTVPETIRAAPAIGPAGPGGLGRPPSGPPPAGDRLSVVALPDAGIPEPRGASMQRSGRGADPRGAERDLRIEQERRAAAAAILFEGHAEAAPPMQAPSPSPASPVPGAGGARTGGPPLPTGEDDPNRQERKNAFLDSEGTGRAGDSLITTLEHPRSPYELQAGTIIPAVLVTGINSDLPGPVIGQVRENVYDTVTGNTLLVPQGSRLLAAYDSMVVWGQERVLVCWQRLVFPNGDSVNLQCMPAADLQGAAGLTDEVNEHWWRILKGASVATLLAATTTIVAGNTDGYNPTVGQTIARNAAGQVNSVGQQLTRRNLDIQPTITVRPGFSVNVIITKDVILTPYRVPRFDFGPGSLFFP